MNEYKENLKKTVDKLLSDLPFSFLKKELGDLILLREEYRYVQDVFPSLPLGVKSSVETVIEYGLLSEIPLVHKRLKRFCRACSEIHSRTTKYKNEVDKLAKESGEIKLDRLPSSLGRFLSTICSLPPEMNTLPLDSPPFEGFRTIFAGFLQKYSRYNEMHYFELQNRLLTDLDLIAENPEHLYSLSSLFRTRRTSFSVKKIGEILSDNLIEYLEELGEDKILLSSRMGYMREMVSLESLGQEYGVTKERIRQKEVRIRAKFLGSAAILGETLFVKLEEELCEDLEKKFSSLASAFSTKEKFCDFLEFFCGCEKERLRKRYYPEFPADILTDFFANNPSPYQREEISRVINLKTEYSGDQVLRILCTLQEKGTLVLKEGMYYPKNLSKTIAAAHALTHFEKGLTSKELVEFVDKNKLANPPLSQSRAGTVTLISGLNYLAGKGVYRHKNFFCFEESTISSAVEKLKLYLQKEKITQCHLYDYYVKAGIDRELDYFDFRHMVREYGIQWGLNFNGKSNTDNVSLGKIVAKISQREVVLKKIESEKRIFYTDELTSCIRSQSSRHLNLYLYELLNAKKILQVQEVGYCSIEFAFECVGKEKILNVIERLPLQKKIIESDILRLEANRKLQLNYPKPFYTSLLSYFSEELGINRKFTLFSKRKIPYSSLSGMCRKVCSLEKSNKENHQILNKKVLATDEAIQRALNVWRNSSAKKEAEMTANLAMSMAVQLSGS